MNFLEVIEKAEKSPNKKEYLKEYLEKNKKKLQGQVRQELKRELYKIIKEDSLIKLKKSVDPELKFHVRYDSLAQGLEPIYFWTLDFLRSKPMGYTVNKTEEEFESSVGGGHFGEIGQKSSVMQDRAISMMERVNVIVRSIINLVYDLKEFDMLLEPYKKTNEKHEDYEKDSQKREAEEYVLRGRWMDQVDIKSGRGSINGLSTGDLQFVTLRDAFFVAKDVKHVSDLDLNARVKNILKRKLAEYQKWREASEIELTKRYNIEKNYLKAQVDSLRIYTKWAKPYLRAAQKLGSKEFKTAEGLPSPELVSTFNNMMMELSLFGKKEIKPGEIHSDYEKYEFDNKFYACVEVKFLFRTIPTAIRTQQGTQYVHTGVVDYDIVPYVLTDDELKLLEEAEVYEDLDLVEQLTEYSLEQLQQDLDEFIGKIEKTEEPGEEKKSGIPNPLEPLKEIGKPFQNLKVPLFSKKRANKYMVEKLKEKAKETATEKSVLLYNVFKKSHRMLGW